MADHENIGALGPAGPGPEPSEPAAGPDSACPSTGAEPAGFGGHAPAGGVPAPALPPWRRTRVRVITGIVIAVLAVLGFVLPHLAGAAAGGRVTLPGTLLGVRENTSPVARAFDRTLVRQVGAGAQGKVVHSVAGYYGVQPGAGFAVWGGGVCGTCELKSAATAFRGFIARRFPGARLFPPGPDGGHLVCAPLSAQNPPLGCWWQDQKTAGLVIYFGGSASGLADAAGKTRQIRAAVEH